MNDRQDDDLMDEGPQEIDLQELGDDGPGQTVRFVPARGAATLKLLDSHHA